MTRKEAWNKERRMVFASDACSTGRYTNWAEKEEKKQPTSLKVSSMMMNLGASIPVCAMDRLSGNRIDIPSQVWEQQSTTSGHASIPAPTEKRMDWERSKKREKKKRTARAVVWPFSLMFIVFLFIFFMVLTSHRPALTRHIHNLSSFFDFCSSPTDTDALSHHFSFL